MQAFLIGLSLALVISWLAYRARSLNQSGALAATLLGTVIFGSGGLNWALLLLGFFISSSGLSRLFGRRKEILAEKFSKGSRRDAVQVLANGGVGGLCALLHLAFPEAGWLWFGYAGALAAVNADTWATELGVLSRSTPRLLSTGKRVERGTSGGVTFEGGLAAAAGAVFIAGLAALLSPLGAGSSLGMFFVVTFAGLTASLIDSLLGATLQAIHFCPVCHRETEQHPLHTCGNTTTQLRGWSWLNNDWVNTVCALTGAILAASFYFLT